MKRLFLLAGLLLSSAGFSTSKYVEVSTETVPQWRGRAVDEHGLDNLKRAHHQDHGWYRKIYKNQMEIEHLESKIDSLKKTSWVPVPGNPSPLLLIQAELELRKEKKRTQSLCDDFDDFMDEKLPIVKKWNSDRSGGAAAAAREPKDFTVGFDFPNLKIDLKLDESGLSELHQKLREIRESTHDEFYQNQEMYCDKLWEKYSAGSVLPVFLENDFDGQLIRLEKNLSKEEAIEQYLNLKKEYYSKFF